MNERILIVDDEPNIRLNYRVALETEGYKVSEAQSGPEALGRFAEAHFDLALLDLRMPGMGGLELLEEMRRRQVTTPVIIITAYGDIPQTVHAMKLGAIDFLQKPLTPDRLRQVAQEVIERHSGPLFHTPPSVDESSRSAETVLSLYLKNAKRLLNLRHFDAARHSLAEAMAIDPLSAEAFNLGGVLFEMQGDVQQAESFYRHAIKVCPDCESARQNLQRLESVSPSGMSRESIPAGRGEHR